jgi:hypothetical protein
MRNLNYYFAFLPLILFCAGCDTDRMPSQKGTWIGLAEPYTLYNANGVPHKVLTLVIQEGPKMGDSGYNEGSFDTSEAMKRVEKLRFIVPNAVIVDNKYFTVNPKLYEGMRLKIRGTIEIATAIDANDKSSLIWITPKFDPHPSEPTPAIIRVKQIDIINSQEIPNNEK